jgi:hypothetical protein
VLSFTGLGGKDRAAQGIDNVELYRWTGCGYQNVIVNGGFEEGHKDISTWQSFKNGEIPGWTSSANSF